MEGAEQSVTKAFLEEQLNKEVDSFLITSGSNAGDNYTSVIYAIDVTLKNGEKKYLVLKAFPNHPARQEFLTMLNMFSKEVNVYTHWIPALQSLDVNLKLPFAPFVSGKAVDYSVEGTDTKNINFLDNYILMTDIRKTEGYTMADRRKGLNYEHAKMALKELAKLHASSWVYMQKNGLKSIVERFEFLKDKTFTEDMMKQFEGMMAGITESAMKHVREELGSDSPIVIGLTKLADVDLSADRMKVFLSSDGVDEEQVESWLRVKPPHDPNYDTKPWVLACHGDSWVNNLMFRYKDDQDREKPEEVILVDLQIYRAACPTTDLTYFLVASTPYQVRTKHEVEFLEIYYNEFLATCDRFSVKPMSNFTLTTLKRRYLRAKIFGFFMGIPLLQIVLQDPTEAVDLETMSEDSKQAGDIFATVFKNSKKHDLLREQLVGLAIELYNDGVV